MEEVKRKISIVALLMAAILAVSCVKTEEVSMPEESTVLPETPAVTDIDEEDLAFVGIVETLGTAEDFN